MSLSSRLRAEAKRALKPLAARFVQRREDLPLSLWNLSRDGRGELALQGVQLGSLLERFGSPLHVVDAQRLNANAGDFLHVPPGASAGVECYYSYKTNPVAGVLSRLHALGIGAEVISEYELWLARRLGMPGDRIVLNGPARSAQALRTAIEIDALWQLNSREELGPLVQMARSLGKRARVGLRAAPSGSWGGQFGEPMAGGVALEVFGELLAHPELDVVAVHAHPGGEVASAGRAEGLAREVIELVDAVRQRWGHTLSIVDLGGSLACPTVSGHGARALRLNRTFAADLLPRVPADVLSIRGYVEAVVGVVERECARRGLPRPRVFVEPGRSLTGNTQLLLCRVLGLKASGAGELVHAILDAGVSVAEPMRSEYHQLFTLSAARSEERRYRLVGPICTPMDTLAWAWRLPELRAGDGLAIMDSGAYFVPFATSFSFPQPAIVALDAGQASLLRRAETFEDLVDRDVRRSEGEV